MIYNVCRVTKKAQKDTDGGKRMDKIDFVMIWVDGNDPEWQKEKNLYELEAYNGQ